MATNAPETFNEHYVVAIVQDISFNAGRIPLSGVIEDDVSQDLAFHLFDDGDTSNISQ